MIMHGSPVERLSQKLSMGWRGGQATKELQYSVNQKVLQLTRTLSERAGFTSLIIS